MSLETILVNVAESALPAVAELLGRIIASPDQRAAAEKAARALEMDALDAATDAGLDATLAKMKG